jgi:hypothetical protein
VLPLQHPFGHDAALQTHCPVVLLHACPAEHALHEAPPVPHEVLDSDAYGSQVPDAVQQPCGHEVASQTHCPVPRLHSSPAEHDLQDAPPAPHDALDSLPSGSQVEPLQHPAHDVPPQVQVPPVQACPLPHAPQVAPAVPHSDADCDANGTQAPPLQHPLGHEAASQTHWPVPLHRWPAEQAPQVAPPVPHEPLLSAA